MKKSLLALAALSAVSGVAFAQSSVTLSGIVDAGVRSTGTLVNGSVERQYALAGSQSAYNRLDFSGREDLGGGLSAFFTLQYRFNLNNGTSNGATGGVQNSVVSSDPFWRTSFVGLGSTSFGDLRLGRILMPLQDMNGGFDPWGTGFIGTHTQGINATIRANNAIYYRSPVLGGFSFHAAIAAGDNQYIGNNGQGEVGTGGAAGTYFTTAAKLGSNSANGNAGSVERPAGVNLRYAAGPLNVGVAWDRNAADLDTAGIYGSYDFGAFKLLGQFEKGDNCTSATVACTTSANGAEDIKAFSVSAAVPLGAFVGKIGYLDVNSDLANRDAHKFALGGDYFLSKRTNLYANVAKWSGNRISAANKETQFDIGVTHRF